MAAFIYFYSKFTEEFLLLSAAAMFTLMAIYSYHWVIKKRRLGAARNQVPAGMVKAYLNQLIGEAQFVRTQLFGLIANGENPENIATFQGLLQKGQSSTVSPSHEGTESSSAISGDLMDRLKALEAQLSEKESMVVNINIEKAKLLEEVENLKQNEKAVQNASATASGEDLSKKIKSLEERLEEYSLFEDDLANLKRLQQENFQLKKRLEEAGPIAGAASEPAKEVTEPAIEATADHSSSVPKDPSPFSLDQHAIDSLLDGVTPLAPDSFSTEEPTVEPTAEPAVEPVVAAAPLKLAVAPSAAEAPAGDDFEKLVDSVENSLETTTMSAAPEAEKPAPKTDENLANKTDEELLKEFENLLNS
jgi:hypothetical protein